LPPQTQFRLSLLSRKRAFTFEYYDNLDKANESKGKLKRMTLPAVEFIGPCFARSLCPRPTFRPT
jgi:hypothetical protein